MFLKEIDIPLGQGRGKNLSRGRRYTSYLLGMWRRCPVTAGAPGVLGI